MRSASFGRRIIEPSGHELVLVPGQEAPSEAPQLANRDELKEQIRAALMSRIDPSVAGRIPRSTLRAEVGKLVSEIATEQRIQLNELEEAALAIELTDDMVGLGPLEPFLEDDEVTDVLVNGPFDVFVERRGKLEKTSARFRDAQHLVGVAQRIAAAIGRRIDEASPMVDARLADGSRVNIVLPPLVLNGGTISIRKFPKHALTLDAMVRQQNLSPELAHLLRIAANARLNILISGGTGSGKTTLLNAVSQHIETTERIITIEDAVELRLQQPHVVQMETRPPNIEGAGHIPQRELVRNALRMRPDRIIVGEVRGPEAFDMLQAMNTGHDGSMTTVHANSPRDALYRIENMVMMANLSLPLKAIRMQVASALNLVVHIERMRDGVRRVQNVAEIAGMEGDIITARELFAFRYQGEKRDGTIDGIFESTRMRPDFITRAARYGLDRELLDVLGIVAAMRA
ncbi:MAG TPA: CpaF family protein [Stellaceae bacterium]|jgi:pilus assembly protein CpaF